MLYAEWRDRVAIIKAQDGRTVRKIIVHHPIVGVQVSGDSTTEAMVAIAMDNGKTDLYKSSGMLVRKGM